MIAYVKGTLEEITEQNVVIEVNGIGYNVRISAGTMGQLPGLSSEVKLYTYTCVREDAFFLYVFLTKEELELFRLLITVNGVGPKGALGVLSVMSVRDLRFAVMGADSRMLAKAPGIGKKTAERIILDLRDKVSFDEAAVETASPVQDVWQASDGDPRGEAMQALEALGYNPAEAKRAVAQVDAKETDVEVILKAALKAM